MWTTLGLAVNIYCRLYWAHALIRHYLKTERKYALIKKHALNKHVRLLTRLYGSATKHNNIMYFNQLRYLSLDLVIFVSMTWLQPVA